MKIDEKVLDKKIEEAKRARNFLKWLVKHHASTYPVPTLSIRQLQNAVDEVEGFIKYEDDGKPRKLKE